MSANPGNPMSASSVACAAGPLRGLRARSATSADLPRIVAIEREIYPFPWTPGNFSDSLAASYEFWLFEDDRGDIVCYAVSMWIPDEIHLLNLGVAAGWQRRGIGRAVLRWLCAAARARGAQGMLLEVRPSNMEALALYESSGFARIGVRRRYYPAADGAREDAWVLFKRFADEPTDDAGLAGQRGDDE